MGPVLSACAIEFRHVMPESGAGMIFHSRMTAAAVVAAIVAYRNIGMRFCIAAEYLQIPSVMIAAPGFDEQAITTALNNGVPALRVAVYPGAFATHTNEQLIENTRNVLWQQVVDALTTEITAEEIESNSRLEGADARTVVYKMARPTKSISSSARCHGQTVSPSFRRPQTV